MPHYPEQRMLSRMTTLQREVILPDEAIGVVETHEDKRVDIRDIVVRGVAPAPHIIIDAMKFFKLRKPEALEPLLLVEEDTWVEELTPLAGKHPERGKRLFSPIRGRVAKIDNGRIILEKQSTTIDLEAGVRGKVISIIESRGVKIEATGAVLQGVWGNGKRAIAPLQMEPENGIENMLAEDIDVKYLGSVVAIRRQLRPLVIDAIGEIGIAGVIAPSIDYGTLEIAQNAPFPILITEGFGNINMSRAALNLLNEFEGQQMTIDAYQPKGWESRRPEVIINRSARSGEQPPSRPNMMLALQTGMNVRVVKDPYFGQTGEVINLPKSPILLDNGLRVPCAQVELLNGDAIFVPLANLEVLGR